MSSSKNRTSSRSESGPMVLRLRINPPGNWSRAKCLGITATSDYDPFFEDMPEAVAFCNGDNDGVICPIRHECLLFALTNNLREGVWGGCSELTRRAIRRKYPMQERREPRPEWAWMSQTEAMNGISIFDLLKYEEEEEDE